MTDTSKLHAYRPSGIEGAGCIEGLGRSHGGVSCGRKALDPIHQTAAPADVAASAMLGTINDLYRMVTPAVISDHDNRSRMRELLRTLELQIRGQQ